MRCKLVHCCTMHFCLQLKPFLAHCLRMLLPLPNFVCSHTRRDAVLEFSALTRTAAPHVRSRSSTNKVECACWRAIVAAAGAVLLPAERRCLLCNGDLRAPPTAFANESVARPRVLVLSHSCDNEAAVEDCGFSGSSRRRRSAIRFVGARIFGCTLLRCVVCYQRGCLRATRSCLLFSWTTRTCYVQPRSTQRSCRVSCATR
jgi:hypothetical protein